MRLASRAAVEFPMKPTRGIFPPCCARAANGPAATAPPRSATNFRRLMEASPPAKTTRRAEAITLRGDDGCASQQNLSANVSDGSLGAIAVIGACPLYTG